MGSRWSGWPATCAASGSSPSSSHTLNKAGGLRDIGAGGPSDHGRLAAADRVNGELQEERAASVVDLVLAQALHPNAPAVGAHHAARDGQAQPRPPALEDSLARR